MKIISKEYWGQREHEVCEDKELIKEILCNSQLVLLKELVEIPAKYGRGKKRFRKIEEKKNDFM